MQMDDGHLEPITAQEMMQQTQLGNEDLIFRVGEIVQVKGGDFRVKSFGRKAMVLEGVPGTRMRRE